MPNDGHDITYTAAEVFERGVADGWAEAETDPTRIDWPERQARAAIPFRVVNGRPVNPCQRTAVRYGRNRLGHWGEQLAADAVVTAIVGEFRWLLMIERADGDGWALPGGYVDPGETPAGAAVRELKEETGFVIPASVTAQPLAPRYVPDPRASDESWMVTVPTLINLGTEATLPTVIGGDDAARAQWLPADDYSTLTGAIRGGAVFAAHRIMLCDLLTEAAAARMRGK